MGAGGGDARRMSRLADDDATAGTVSPTQAVRRAWSSFDPSRYPEPDSGDLKARLQEGLGVDARRIVMTNGASEVAHLLVRTIGAGSLAFMVSPADPEWERAARLAGLITAGHTADAGASFDLAACCARIGQLKPAVVFVASPNPATGRSVTSDELGALIEATGRGLLVLDDSLACFASHPPDLREWLQCGNFVLMRSLAPAFGLGGLRIGHAVANPELATALSRQQPRWSVNAAAQRAAAAALADIDRYRRIWIQVRRQREAMSQRLSVAGFSVLDTDADFVAIEIGAAADHAKRLRCSHTRVADGAEFGLPRLLRLGARGASECALLLRDLQEGCASIR